MNPYLSLSLGLLCAALGGEFFVRGAVGLAGRLRVSAGIIGATFAAFATSAPEFSVGVQSALAGEPEISLGDSLGSNVINIALVLGLALAFAPLRCERRSFGRDFRVALIVPVMTGALCLDGVISRLDGVLLLALFAVWLAFTVRDANGGRREAAPSPGSRRPVRELLAGCVGLGLLAVAGNRIVAGASTLALAWGFDDFIVGATVVALGTSAPELATVVVAKCRGHDEVGVGTVLGSNLFNGLFIAGTVACVHPIPVNWRETGTALLFGVISVAFIRPNGEGRLGRLRGVGLLAIYAAYLWAVLSSSGKTGP